MSTRHSSLVTALTALGLAIRAITWMPGNGWLVEFTDRSELIGANEDLVIENARIKVWARKAQA